MKFNDMFKVLPVAVGVLLLSGSPSFAETKCDFVALSCTEAKNCPDYKPKKVYLFGGDVDHLVDLYIMRLIEAGVSEKHISKSLEIDFFDDKERLHSVKVPPLMATFGEDRKKLLEHIKKKAEGKTAAPFTLSSEKVKNMAKSADIFACRTVASPMPVGTVAPIIKQPEGNAHQHRPVATETLVIYSIISDKQNPLKLTTPRTKKDKTAIWQVGSPEAQVYFGAELPENFHATMNVIPVEEGAIAAGFSKRNEGKPNYEASFEGGKAVLRKQGETSADLDSAPFQVSAGKKLKLEIIRDHKVVRVLANGNEVLTGMVDADDMLTMKRFFVRGTFQVSGLKIQELKKR